MESESKVKFGVIGLGAMGMLHAEDLGNIPQAVISAVCDVDPSLAKDAGERFQAPAFMDYREMLAEADLEAVIIATPHYQHPPISIAAFRRGIHVLVEKPIAVHTKSASEMVAAYEMAKSDHPNLLFGAMFQQRTYGHWRKIKSMIDDGELGELVRATWIITDWFRTQIYYDDGGWRATWKGEGGGVLLNQCPHNLDLYQWFFGLPQRVTGFASIGKYHHIEVEDEVTGYFVYEYGMVGHFVTSTAESPGTNRLEIVGELGKLIFEGDRLVFFKNRSSMFEQIELARTGFEKVDYEVVDVPYTHHGEPGHRLVTENFVDAILNGDPLIAPGVEGLNSLELGNAIVYSSLKGETVQLPIDAGAYADTLQELAENSTFQKAVRQGEKSDLRDSF